MKERPILFSGPMVRAILQNKKTQTRRVVKPQGAILTDDMAEAYGITVKDWTCRTAIPCPFGSIGTKLWVRETWRRCPKCFGYNYRADCNRPKNCSACDESLRKWIPSIHMPCWASRITLEITGVRVERLQEISEEDAKADGAERGIYCGVDDEGPALRSIDCESDERIASYRGGFRFLWECINGPGSWEKNPWVWVIEFRRVKP